MRQPDDFIRMELAVVGTINVPLEKVDLDWPPPERLVCCTPDEEGIVREPTDLDPEGIVLTRVSMSEWPDDVVASSEHLARGALYRYV